MGKGLVTTGIEQADQVAVGSFTGTGQVNLGVFLGYFRFYVTGTFVGTVRLECSYDGGATWVPASLDTLGDYASYTQPVSVVGFEPEKGVFYRINCTAYTSGTINVRMSSNVNFTGQAWGA